VLRKLLNPQSLRELGQALAIGLAIINVVEKIAGAAAAATVHAHDDQAHSADGWHSIALALDAEIAERNVALADERAKTAELERELAQYLRTEQPTSFEVEA